MSLKVQFLYSHLEYFQQNLGKVSQKYGERLDEDIGAIEEKVPRKMVQCYDGHYILSLMRDDQAHNRKACSSVSC